jgi:hypothetical protein
VKKINTIFTLLREEWMKFFGKKTKRNLVSSSSTALFQIIIIIPLTLLFSSSSLKVNYYNKFIVFIALKTYSHSHTHTWECVENTTESIVASVEED